MSISHLLHQSLVSLPTAEQESRLQQLAEAWVALARELLLAL